MIRFARKSALVVCVLALVVAGVKPAAANIVRVIGPTTVINDPEGLIKFDVAFDTVNQVYLVVWGTQAVNLHGQFLNVNGQPIGAPFTIQNLSGWVRVTYSAQQQKFMLGYTRITFWPPAGSKEPPMHARYIKFITFNPATSGPNIGPEIFLDFIGSSPGNSTGVAYSPAYGVFFATWHKYVTVPGADWAVPRSYVAAIDPNGTVLAINELTNPFLGQSDPNIACGNSGQCLVVGFGWNNAAWGRLIDGPLGTPLGVPWDIAVTPNDSHGNPVGTLGDATVAYSQLQDKFVVLYVRNFNTIWGKTVGLDGTATDPYVVLQSTPATESLVGPGYGVPNLAYNAGTSSFLVSGRDYFGRSDAQETDSAGLPLAGSWDQLPPVGESEYVNTATDPINRRMALFDNQNFNSIRIALYEIGDPHVLNGNFSDGANNWFGFASPDATGLTTNVTGGVYQFYRTLPVGGSNFAFVYQDTAMAFAPGTRLHAQFDLGNSSSVPKSIRVVLHTNFNDTKECTFNLPANSPLRTYQVRAITSIAWGRASILFEALTAGSDGGYYLLDNVVIEAAPSQTNTGTECVEGGSARAELTSPAPFSTLTTTAVTFEWTGGQRVTRYWLHVGSTLGGADLFNQDQGTNLSTTVPGLPTDGRTLYVRLWSVIGGVWQFRDHAYTAATGASALAELVTPAPSSTLTAATVAFEWTGGRNVTQYWLHVGSTLGGADLFSQDQGTNLGTTVPGLPTDGRTLYVRLWSVIGGVWQFRDHAYTAATGASALAELVTPAPLSTLTATTVAFEWTGGRNVTRYWLYVGSTPGGADLFSQDQGTNLRTIVPGLPADTSTLYVRLWSVIGGAWFATDYTYKTAGIVSARAEMLSPAPGSTLQASTVRFQWTGGVGVSLRWLQIGTTVGGADLYNADPGATSLGATVAGLPSNGSPVYVRLWSLTNGGWQLTDYTYAAATGASALAELVTPAPSSTLTAATVAFEWTGGRNVTRYWLHVGSTLGGADLFSQDQGTNLGTTVPGLPTDGRTLYVRLWSVIGGVWQFRDHAYTAATGASALAELVTPAPLSTLTATTVAFEWTGGRNVTRYWLYVGSTPGGADLFSQDQGTNLRTIVPGLPADTSTLHIRLWSVIDGVWQFRDY